MPHHEHRTVSGTVVDVFAHRFVVDTADGHLLADLTPKGAGKVTLNLGDTVTLHGQMRPSELKVERFRRGDEPEIEIDHATPHEDDVDPTVALQAAKAEGYTVLGRPRRKPKHFEVLGRDAASGLWELHVELDGTLRKRKAVDAADGKWSEELRAG